MKKLILHILFLFVCFTSNAQWRPVSLGTNNALSSVYFTSPETGWIVGESIFKTTNAGATWTTVDSVYSVFIKQNESAPGTGNSVFFPNADSGVIVCNGGEILRTTDKGATWNDYLLSNIPNWSQINWTSVFFTDASNGYAVGGLKGFPGIIASIESIIKTTDGGITWNALKAPRWAMLNSVYFTSASTGYAVGDSGFIIKTTNGGTSWDTLKRVTTQRLSSVFFTDANNGFVGTGNGVILKTTDAGSSWTSISMVNFYGIRSIYFPNATIGYAVGTGCGYKTIDGGSTWTWASDSLSFVDYNSVFFTSATVGYTVGQNGAYAKTTNGAAQVTVNNIDKLNNSNFELYPNPTSSILYLKNGIQNDVVSVYNLQGQIVLKVLNTNNQINVGNLTEGTYIIKISNAENVIVDKFVKR